MRSTIPLESHTLANREVNPNPSQRNFADIDHNHASKHTIAEHSHWTKHHIGFDKTKVFG